MARLNQLIRFDWFMKFMFRDKVDFEILSGFLSELMKEDVEVIAVLESESNQRHVDDKFNRVDVMVKTAEEELVIVEIQNEFEIDFFQRLLYGASKATVEYMQKGEKYAKVKRVISVCIVYFELGQGEDYVYVGENNFIGLHRKDILQLTKKQQDDFHRERVSDLFPLYYLIRATLFQNIVNDGLDEWIYFFKNEKVRDNFTAKGLAKAKEVLAYHKMPYEEKKEYEAYYENLSESNSWAYTKKAELEEAEEKGMEKGMEKGREEGAAKKEQEAVVNFHKNGVSIPIIAKSLQISEESVEAILANLKGDE